MNKYTLQMGNTLHLHSLAGEATVITNHTFPCETGGHLLGRLLGWRRRETEGVLSLEHEDRSSERVGRPRRVGGLGGGRLPLPGAGLFSLLSWACKPAHEKQALVLHLHGQIMDTVDYGDLWKYGEYKVKHFEKHCLQCGWSRTEEQHYMDSTW